MNNIIVVEAKAYIQQMYKNAKYKLGIRLGAKNLITDLQNDPEQKILTKFNDEGSVDSVFWYDEKQQRNALRFL